MPEAIRHFCLEGGMSQTEVTVPLENLYSENRKILDPKCNRYFFVGDPVRIKIENAPKRKIELKLHPEKNEGKRAFEVHDEFFISGKDFKAIKKGELVRLMDNLNFVKKDKKFVFDSLEVEKYKGKGKKIIHWLTPENIEAEIMMPDSSLVKGICEKSLEKLNEGDMVQLVRTGFCRLDKKEKNKIAFWMAHN